MKYLIALAVLFSVFAAPAVAAPQDHLFPPLVSAAPAAHAVAAKHHHAAARKAAGGHRHAAPVQGDYVPAATAAPSGNLVVVAERYIGGNPTGWAHEWCGKFLNAVVLPAAGIRGTGDQRAISFARWGSPAGPAPGVVAVFAHHVTIVVRVNGDGTFDGVGGNQGHRVSVNRFPMGRVVAWRAP